MKTFKQFLSEKGLTEETFAAKSAEDMASLYNEFNEISRKSLEFAIENKASKEDIESLKSSIVEAQNEQLKALNETLKQHGLAIKKLTAEEKANTATVSDIRKELEKNLDKLKQLKGEDISSVKGGEFTIKASGTMLESNNISGGNVPVEQRIAGFNTIASRRIRLMDLFSTGNATSNIISWVYQANKDGAAGTTVEGATKNQIDFDLVVASQVVVKYSAFIKVSTEMIDDIDFIESEIRNELMRELMKVIELGSYSGNGTAPNLNGIRTVATAFTAGTFALTVDNANEVDVLVVAMNQIAIAEQEQPNAILMNPSDVTALKLIKVTATDKRYVDRLVMIAGQLMLDGVPIIPTTLVTAGTYLVGYFPLATLYTKGGINIQVGLDGNDFTKNLRTILAEWRGALVTKNNDRTAFVKGTFATDKAALETA
jgi:HK97 family phage major capsid protein